MLSIVSKDSCVVLPAGDRMFLAHPCRVSLVQAAEALGSRACQNAPGLGRLMNILPKVSYSCKKLDSLKFKAETENSYGDYYCQSIGFD